MRKIIQVLLNKFGYYRIDQLVIGGHCGCCGAWVEDEILVDDGFRATLCREYIEENK